MRKTAKQTKDDENSADKALSEELEKDMAQTSKGRRKGSGYLYRLPSGTWQARWRDRLTKKIITRSTGTTIHRDAIKKLNEFTAYNFLKTVEARAASITETYGSPAEKVKRYEEKKPGFTFQQAFDTFKQLWKLKKPSTSERSYKSYRGHLAALESWLATHAPDATELRHITRVHATGFLTDLQSRKDVGTYNKHLTFFKCLWRILADVPGAKLKENPWEKFDAAAHKVQERRELTVEELTRVCSSVEGEMRLLFAIGIYTGLRLHDCALLDWGTVDLVRGIIQLTPNKIKNNASARPVTIPIHATLSAMLAETPSKQRTGFVLPKTAARYLQNDSLIARDIKRVFTKCGIATSANGDEIADGVDKGKHKRAKILVGFHSLRHTYVSLSANAGVPLAIVQAIVGHSNPAMTRHYFHADTQALTNAVAALPNVIDVECKDVKTEPERVLSFRKALKAIIATNDKAEIKAARKIWKELTHGK